MSTDIKNTPDTWGFAGVTRVTDSPDPGVFVMFRTPEEGETPASAVVVWHWHTPTNGEPRWQAARCSAHTLVSLKPLHLEPSLGCEGGCPNHGYIRKGTWTNA